MALTLFLKRSKIFLDQTNGEGGERRWQAQAAPQPVQAPDWVALAPGFAEGIKDGSITDLTPPKAKKHKSVEEEPSTLPEIEATGEEEEDEEPVAEEPSKTTKKSSRAGAGTITASGRVK